MYREVSQREQGEAFCLAFYWQFCSENQLLLKRISRTTKDQSAIYRKR